MGRGLRSFPQWYDPGKAPARWRVAYTRWRKEKRLVTRPVVFGSETLGVFVDRWKAIRMVVVSPEKLPKKNFGGQKKTAAMATAQVEIFYTAPLVLLQLVQEKRRPSALPTLLKTDFLPLCKMGFQASTDFH